MILYDSNAYKSGMVGKFEGRRSWDKDKSVFESFQKAKKVAIANAKLEMKELEERISELEQMTEETCPWIPNPFGTLNTI